MSGRFISSSLLSSESDSRGRTGAGTLALDLLVVAARCAVVAGAETVRVGFEMALVVVELEVEETGRGGLNGLGGIVVALQDFVGCVHVNRWVSCVDSVERRDHA